MNEIEQAQKDNSSEHTSLDQADTIRKQQEIIVNLRDENRELRESILDREKGDPEQLEEYLDLSLDGRRLNRAIKHIYTRMKHSKNDDVKCRLGNTLATLTAKKMEIADIITRLHEVVKNIEKEQNKKPDKRYNSSY